MRWIVAQRLSGRSAASIAWAFTERGVACPSQADPSRNRHREGEEWSLRAVIEILGSLRYTGRQVWNRRAVDRNRRRPGTGQFARTRNAPDQWLVSAQVVHPALVSEEDFVAAQAMRVARPAADGEVGIYRLAGLVWCGVCERRMEAHRVHGRVGYRCRHGYRSSRVRPTDAPRNVYVREEHLIGRARHDLEENGYPIGPEPDHVVALLRSNDGSVVCTTTAITLVLSPSPLGQGAAQTNIQGTYSPEQILSS